MSVGWRSSVVPKGLPAHSHNFSRHSGRRSYLWFLNTWPPQLPWYPSVLSGSYRWGLLRNPGGGWTCHGAFVLWVLQVHDTNVYDSKFHGPVVL